jgi:hypothetical protein
MISIFRCRYYKLSFIFFENKALQCCITKPYSSEVFIFSILLLCVFYNLEVFLFQKTENFSSLKDYGSAWRILRLPSLTDQIFIKAQRIRSIENNGFSKVDEGVVPEYIGIINYSIMALVQLEKGVATQPDMSAQEADEQYAHWSAVAKELMENKNHDYGEAWREMRVSSLTDLILQKLLYTSKLRRL